MASGTHKVVVWVKDKSKEFLITARKPDARLADVTRWARDQGFRALPPLMENVSKATADAERARVKAEYIGNKFKYRSFPQM